MKDYKRLYNAEDIEQMKQRIKTLEDYIIIDWELNKARMELVSCDILKQREHRLLESVVKELEECKKETIKEILL